MDFIKIKSPLQKDEYGDTVRCTLYAEGRFTMGDVTRLRRTVEDCRETVFNGETFDEFIERVVRTHNEKHGTKFGVVYPSYEVDI